MKVNPSNLMASTYLKNTVIIFLYLLKKNPPLLPLLFFFNPNRFRFSDTFFVLEIQPTYT